MQEIWEENVEKLRDVFETKNTKFKGVCMGVRQELPLSHSGTSVTLKCFV